MTTSAIRLAAVGISAAVVLTACGSGSSSSSTTKSGSGASSAPAPSSSSSGGSGGGTASGKVGVILPDTQSSARWETEDKPLLAAAFKDAGIEADIQNAQNSKDKFGTIADGMIQQGVKVLIITNLDSASGAAVEAKAKAAGIKTIDYDRLTLGGGADYYVSFDNVKVGELQGQGLATALKGKKGSSVIEINGSPTDNNATLFKKGYDSVLDPLYKSGDLVKKGDQSIPDWKNDVGGTVFEQLLTKSGGKVDGVLAANDGLGNAIITVLKKNGLKVPVTGQDATVQGLQNILAGDQYMTVYKAIKGEAKGAADLAVSLIKGTDDPAATGQTMDTQTKQNVKSVLLVPQAITKDNVKAVVDDGFVKAAELCTGSYAAMCKTAGIS